jgi:hypothetical protein
MENEKGIAYLKGELIKRENEIEILLNDLKL